jgi:hypothetical protein
MEIIRENIDVPKSEIEIELNKKREEDAIKRANLELAGGETEKDKRLKKQAEKREFHFESFKQHFGLPSDVTMERLFAEVSESIGAFDDYIKNMEGEQEDEAADYAVDEAEDTD